MDNTPEYLKGMSYTWNNTVPVPEKDWVVSTFISNFLNTAKLKPASSVNSVPVSEFLLSDNQKLIELEICNNCNPPGKLDCCTDCSYKWFVEKLKDLGVDELQNSDPNIIDGAIEGLRRLFSGGEPTPRQIVDSCSKSLSCVTDCLLAYCFDSGTKLAQCKMKNNCRYSCSNASCCPECENIFKEVTDCAYANAYNCAPCWNNTENFNRCMDLFKAIQDANHKKREILISCLTNRNSSKPPPRFTYPIIPTVSED